jgi:ELWxxDGT repeat protein
VVERRHARRHGDARGHQSGSGSSSPELLGANANIVFFRANDGTHGTELWGTDGTPGGTVLLKDINPGSGSGVPLSESGIVNGNLYFAADDGTHGLEPFVSNGTVGSGTLVKDINPGSGGSAPGQFTDPGDNYVYFSADDGSGGGQIWRTDGTGPNTTKVLSLTGGVSALMHAAGELFFASNDGTHGLELYSSPSGANLSATLLDINPGAGSSNPRDLTYVDGQLLFVANDGSYGAEVWQTTGLSGDTRMVTDVNPKKGVGSTPDWITPIGSSNAIFAANDGKTGSELHLAFIPPTVITKVKPTVACPGSFVTITGKWFRNADMSGNGVSFNNQPATQFTVDSDTQITAMVPTGASANGNVQVDSGNGMATSPFTIPAPSVKKVSPASGPAGTTTLTITGSCLADGTPDVNGTALTNVTHTGDTEIQGTVDNGTTTGLVHVTSTHGTGTSKKPFTVTP